MRVLVVCVLVGWAGVSALRLEAWRDDEALWRAAVAVSPDAPRPASNLAAAVIAAGHPEEGLAWSLRAASLARGRGDGPTLAVVARQVAWLEMTSGVCGRPDVRWACAGF